MSCMTVSVELKIAMTVNAHVSLDGGKKKKKKKKNFQKPKRIPHKHKKVKMAVLNYFNVDKSGKVTKLRKECSKCTADTFMAEHKNRFHCGQCGLMFVKGGK